MSKPRPSYLDPHVLPLLRRIFGIAHAVCVIGLGLLSGAMSWPIVAVILAWFIGHLFGRVSGLLDDERGDL